VNVIEQFGVQKTRLRQNLDFCPRYNFLFGLMLRANLPIMGFKGKREI